MGVFNYKLEVLVPRVNLRKIPIQDPKDLKVEIEFPKGKLTFTSSQLNLSSLAFCGENGLSFEADSETIKDELINGPLKVTVKLKDTVVGTGEIPWPKKFVDGMSENMEVFTEGANTDLKMDDKVVGCLEVILRLQGCCNYCVIEEANENEEEQTTDIDAGDIMFLMDDGEGCKKKEPEPEEDPCKGRLNLANYKDSNGKVVVSPEFHNACTSPQCIGLKKMGGHFEKVVKSLVCAGLQDVRANKKEKCCNPCDLKLDPCTGQFVCPPSTEPNCCGNCGQQGALPLSKGEIECSIKIEIIKVLNQVFEDSD